MSFFWFTLSAPKNTTLANAINTTLILHHGVINHVSIYIPNGSAGLFHLQLFDALHQLYPLSTGEDFHGDDITIDFKEWYDLDVEPYTLVSKCWNDDDTFSHEIIVCFSVLPKWILIPQLFTDTLKSAWSKLVGKEIEED